MAALSDLGDLTDLLGIQMQCCDISAYYCKQSEGQGTGPTVDPREFRVSFEAMNLVFLLVKVKKRSVASFNPNVVTLEQPN